MIQIRHVTNMRPLRVLTWRLQSCIKGVFTVTRLSACSPSIGYHGYNVKSTNFSNVKFVMECDVKGSVEFAHHKHKVSSQRTHDMC